MSDFREISPASAVEQGLRARKRNIIIVAAMLPIAALFGLLGWFVAQSEGTPGAFGINSRFGEIQIETRVAHEFVGDGLDGEPVSLSELRGKVVMLDFWSSWCPPCRREAPTLAQVYREYEGKNVEFVGLAIWDDRRDVARHVREFGLPYPNVLDDQGRIAINYGVAGIPEKFFIDTHGNLVQKFVGPMSPEALRTALDSLLAHQVSDEDSGD